MKNENVITFTVRLNQNKVSHRRAWEILQSASESHTEMIVSALNTMSENKALAEMKQLICNCVRDALEDASPQMAGAISSAGQIESFKSNAEISDDDFDIADDFMDSL